jgi:hypothetical protein
MAESSRRSAGDGDVSMGLFGESGSVAAVAASPGGC